MAKTDPKDYLKSIHGKLSRTDNIYYYTNAQGHQFARKRDESYHKHKSPKQLWLMEAFKYAHQQLKQSFESLQAIAQTEQEWISAMKIAPNGKQTRTARAWKFVVLQYNWKQEHPFEQWYGNYMDKALQKVEEKTSSETVSDYMIQTQIDRLKAEIANLEQLKQQRHR